MTSSKEEEIKEQEVSLSLDDSFVHYFLKKGGKFLYCTTKDEVITHLTEIIKQNNWEEITCRNPQLKKLLKTLKVQVYPDVKKKIPFFTMCEHLIADNGNILFSSNQLESHKLNTLSEDFIVYATTSQLVKNTGEGLTGIRVNFRENIPTNISAVKDYSLEKDDDNFLNYGNSNSKNLYLLLFEDL